MTQLEKCDKCGKTKIKDCMNSYKEIRYYSGFWNGMVDANLCKPCYKEFGKVVTKFFMKQKVGRPTTKEPND